MNLKAFKITLMDEVGIIAAPTVSKARYLIYLHCKEWGFTDNATGKPWPALPDLSVRRAPGFDLWAQAQQRPRHLGKHYAELEQAPLLRQLHAPAL